MKWKTFLMTLSFILFDYLFLSFHPYSVQLYNQPDFNPRQTHHHLLLFSPICQIYKYTFFPRVDIINIHVKSSSQGFVVVSSSPLLFSASLKSFSISPQTPLNYHYNKTSFVLTRPIVWVDFFFSFIFYARMFRFF